MIEIRVCVICKVCVFVSVCVQMVSECLHAYVMYVKRRKLSTNLIKTS